MPFSEGRGSYCSIILETVQLLQEEDTSKKILGKNHTGLCYGRRGSLRAELRMYPLKTQRREKMEMAT